MNIEECLNEYDEQKDNPNELSDLVVKLSAILYTHNTTMATAEYNEKKSIISLLHEARMGTDKLSVTQAEKQGVVDTENRYGILKAQGEAIVEIIQAIKVRIKVLQFEHDQTSNP